MEKFAVVTGAASGIGAYVSLKLAQSNYVVYAIDITKIEKSKNIIPITVDLSDELATNKAFQSINKIDIAINCAGIPALRKPVIELSLKEVNDNWRLNFSMAFNALKNELAIMRKIDTRKTRKIINIASISAHKGMKHMLTYSAAKASIVNLTKIAAIENSEHKILINSISPATIDTPWIYKKYNGKLRDYSNVFYTKNCGTVDDIYSGIQLFITNEFLTGYDLKMDGGITDLCVI